ncbi:hypothetical protein [Antarctobacter heliothermus]|uniref:Uncharacterized protein n=1 Tax=Antarctobacter heliothermus TaxID=74033 RepID=A0A239LBV3_9RHOB|nr:hypothetical protein [Antarctobacter heliothermus]SNT27109.1 hypothetical protein SAMN04488078_108318 [Antarctobacter heliothermus]
METQTLKRLKAARAKIARMLMAEPKNEAYALHFRRAEEEVTKAEAHLSDDILTRARAVAG